MFKKNIKIIFIMIIVLVAILFLIGLFRGIYLNLTLTEESFFNGSKNNFNIFLIKADNVGNCNNIYEIYPWQYPSSHYLDGNCVTGINPRPFNFYFTKGWKDRKKTNSRSFIYVRNLFFKKKLTLCFDNYTEPLYIEENIYYDQNWVYPSIKGLQYNIKKLTKEQKIKWKKYIDNSIKYNDFSEKVWLINGLNCSDYSKKDIVRELDVYFGISNQTKAGYSQIILNNGK